MRIADFVRSRLFAIVAAAVLALLVAGAAAWFVLSPATRSMAGGEALVGGPFALTDQHGEGAHRAGLRRALHAGLFRLHPLPGRLPAGAGDHHPGAGARCRPRAAATGPADLHHPRPRARHRPPCSSTSPASTRASWPSPAARPRSRPCSRPTGLQPQGRCRGRGRIPHGPLHLHLRHGPGRQVRHHFSHGTTPEEMAKRLTALVAETPATS